MLAVAGGDAVGWESAQDGGDAGAMDAAAEELMRDLQAAQAERLEEPAAGEVAQPAGEGAAQPPHFPAPSTSSGTCPMARPPLPP